MSARTHSTLKADLAQLGEDRATIARERNLLDRWEASLNREEAGLRRALSYVDPAGQHVLLDQATGRSYTPQSKDGQRNAVLLAYVQGAGAMSPLHDVLSQVELEAATGLDSGALSRAVRDLEVMAKLERAGKTARRSTIWKLTDEGVILARRLAEEAIT